MFQISQTKTLMVRNQFSHVMIHFHDIDCTQILEIMCFGILRFIWYNLCILLVQRKNGIYFLLQIYILATLKNVYLFIIYFFVISNFQIRSKLFTNLNNLTKQGQSYLLINY